VPITCRRYLIKNYEESAVKKKAETKRWRLIGRKEDMTNVEKRQDRFVFPDLNIEADVKEKREQAMVEVPILAPSYEVSNCDDETIKNR
jgi:hypothetical protein